MARQRMTAEEVGSKGIRGILAEDSQVAHAPLTGRRPPSRLFNIPKAPPIVIDPCPRSPTERHYWMVNGQPYRDTSNHSVYRHECVYCGKVKDVRDYDEGGLRETVIEAGSRLSHYTVPQQLLGNGNRKTKRLGGCL